MKVLVLLLILVCSATKLAAQKKVLDIEEYRNWTPDIERRSVQGNYATLIRNGQLTIHYLKTGTRKNIPAPSRCSPGMKDLCAFYCREIVREPGIF